jgi:hypothetical protein
VTAVLAPAYVLGVVPPGSSVPAADPSGPFSELRLVEAGGLAALVGSPPADRPLGRAADLLAHDRLLAELVAVGTPVLPMRFGVILDDDAAVTDEFLGARRADLLADLELVTGRVQYTVKARYEQDAILREVIDEEPDVRQLRSGRGEPETAESLDRRIRLGQLVVQALERRRPRDAEEVLRIIGDQVAMTQRETSAAEDVLNAAFLVDRAQADTFERRVERVAEQQAGRLRVSLLGPLPAYDFVGGR